MTECQCGCGKDAGYCRGKPNRFIKGHQARGKNNIFYGAHLIGELSPSWKADDIDNSTLHKWLRKNWPQPKPTVCQTIGCKNPIYDLCNISIKYNANTYTRDFKNWRWQCRSCHASSDDRIGNIYNNSKRDLTTGRFVSI